MKRKLTWLLFNGLFAAGIYFAFFKNVVGAERVVILYTWVALIISILIQNDKRINLLREKGRSVPKLIDVTFGLSVVVVFVWFGAWITASAYLLHLIFHFAAWEKATDKS